MATRKKASKKSAKRPAAKKKPAKKSAKKAAKKTAKKNSRGPRKSAYEREDAYSINAEQLAALLDDAAAVGNHQRLRDLARSGYPKRDPSRRDYAVSDALQARARAIADRLAGKINDATENEALSERALARIEQIDAAKKSTKKNPTKAQHKAKAIALGKVAQEHFEIGASLLRAGNPVAALYETVIAVVVVSQAYGEAMNADDEVLAQQVGDVAVRVGELFGAVLAEPEVHKMFKGGKKGRRTIDIKAAANNPDGRHPGGVPNFMIRTHSSALLAGTKDIYLVVNTQGQVMDAVITPGEDFGPIESAGYGNLSILDLDISGAQYRKLIKLAEELQKIVVSRPTYRPARHRRPDTDLVRGYRMANPQDERQALLATLTTKRGSGKKRSSKKAATESNPARKRRLMR